jgi:regulatory protein YycH of two-component signal transduction system YycFG
MSQSFEKKKSRKLMLILSMTHLLFNLKKKREAPKIRENEIPRNSIEKNQNDGFQSCHNASLHSSLRPSIALQDSTKEINTQRSRRFHNTPLNLPKIEFHMPNIPIEIFSTFFGHALEDAEQHLINFKGTCYDFNLTEDNVTLDYSYKLYKRILLNDIVH